MRQSASTRRGFLTGRGFAEDGPFPPDAATTFAHNASIGNDCLAINYVDCQTCRDACPEMAIRFEARIGGPFVPHLDADRCSGCGTCIAICPASAISMKPRAAEAAHA